MSGPRFADAFRAHVVPRLRDRIATLAMDVAAGEVEFSEAVNATMMEAMRLGAGYLAPGALDALMDWVLSTMTEAVSESGEALDAAWDLVERTMREPSREAIRASVREFLDV